MRAAAARVALCACVVLASCATAPRYDTSPLAPAADAPFAASGRLSARHRSEAAAANFRWSHTPSMDDLELVTPLGQTLARLSGDARGVRLELPDGRRSEAGDWESLTTRVFGAPIPVRGLAWWIRGFAHPRGPHQVERGAGGRVVVLRQDGWEIVYDYDDGAARPRRLRMSYPDTEVRLVVDAWDGGS